VAIIYYFDQNVARAIANGVRMRGIDVLTAFEDIHFAGIVFAQMEQSLIKVYIHDLAIIAQVASPSEMENQVLYLPL
jgi:hypothetical protein